MTHSLRTTLTAGLASVALALAMLVGFGSPSQAQTQEGLVNVNVSEVVVQLPIAVAANVCDVNVNVLARQLRTGDAACDSAAESGATVPWPNQNRSTQQEGLVNVNVSDIIVQVPIGIAANICDVNVNALAEQARTGDATCEAIVESIADAG
jgi:hypothetical protein